MKKLFLSAFLALLFLTNCNNDNDMISGATREFTVTSTTTDWPTNDYQAISRTYNVVANGAEGNWDVVFMEPTNDFKLEKDFTNNQFTIAIEANAGKEIRTSMLKISYSGEMKHMKLTQISNYFSVSEGTDLGDGRKGYTVNSDGTSSYNGDITNPAGATVRVTYLSGTDDVFTPVLTPDVKPTTLSFTAVANATYLPREAKFKVEAAGKPEQAVTITVRQAALVLPKGAIADNTAPGGYYYRLASNDIDVAGVDLVEYNEKTWTQIFDPDNTVPNVEGAAAPVNPCPEGWAAPTVDQGKKIIEATNYEGNGGSRVWKLANGEKVNIFGVTSGYLHLWGSQARYDASTPQARRITVYQAPAVTSTARTATSAGNAYYRVRCVREPLP